MFVIAQGISPSDRARPLQQNIIVERHYPTAKAAPTCLCAAKNPPANKVAGTNTSYPHANRCNTIRTGYPNLGRRNKKNPSGRYPTAKSRLDLRVVKNPLISTKHPTQVGVGAIHYAQRVLRPQTELGIIVKRRYPTAKAASTFMCAVKNPHSSNKHPTHLESARQGSHRTGGSTLSDSGLGRSSTPIKAEVKYAEVASHPPKPPIYQQKPAIQQAEWYSAKHDHRPF
jgi:hypothetical protein